MAKDINEMILEELREFRKDMNYRVASLEGTRSEQKGAMKAYIMVSAAIGAFITYFIDFLRHP